MSSPKSPRNSARTPSTDHENGLNRETVTSQPGAPNSREIGASASSLRTFSAVA